MSLADNLKKVKNGKRPGKKRAKKTSLLAPAKKSKKKAAPVRKKRGNTTLRIDRAMFCKELIKNSMNATAAYKAVSPKVTDKTAAQQGHILLREHETIEILTPLLQALFIDAGIEADYVFKRWVEFSLATPLDYFDVDDDGYMKMRSTESLTPAQRTNLRKVTVTSNETSSKDGDRIYKTERIQVEVVDQQKAVDTIGKHLGLLVDKLAEEDVERIGDLLTKGVARIRASRDLEGWRSIVFDGETIDG